jgi:hypothetical protein
MADELVLHYKGTDRLLGSPERLNAAMAVVGVALVISSAAWLLTPMGDLAIFPTALSALVILVLGYSRLRFANAGLFLAGGHVGVMGTLGARTAVDASEVDHFQMCTVAPPGATAYRLLLFIDRSGRAPLRLPTADLIPADGLTELSRQSGIPIQGSWQETYQPAQLAIRFPGSVSRLTTSSSSVLDHPIRTWLITAGVTCLVSVILGIALFIRSR